MQTGAVETVERADGRPVRSRSPLLLMPRLRLDDDGQSLTLDLHGARVDQAVDLSHAAVVEAARYGRQTVRLVHGLSTTEAGAVRTIKTELLDAYDDGAFDRHATGAVRMEGVLILSIAPAPSPLAGRVRLADLR